jgi:hypothetical protein
MFGDIRARPVLIGMATIAELGFSQRHAGPTLVTVTSQGHNALLN